MNEKLKSSVSSLFYFIKIMRQNYSLFSIRRFKEAMMHHSAIYHDRPQRPVERAAFWIEHVIKHGGDYMRSPVNDLVWYQHYLLDVVCFLTGVFLIFFLLLLSYLFRCICGLSMNTLSRKYKKE